MFLYLSLRIKPKRDKRHYQGNSWAYKYKYGFLQNCEISNKNLLFGGIVLRKEL